MSGTRSTHPSSGASDRPTRAVRAWVGFYTRGLPAELAATRLALMDAELWDEAQAAEWLGESATLGRQRMSRMVRGVPADLAWRLEQRGGTSAARKEKRMPISKPLLAAVVAAAVLYGVYFVGLVATPDFRAWEDGAAVALVGLGLAIVGSIVAIPNPRVGCPIGLAGSAIAIFIMPWMLPMLLPVPVVLGYRWLASRPPTAESHPARDS